MQTKPNYTLKVSLHYKVPFGKALYLSGSVSELGDWDTTKALKMDNALSTLWTCRFHIQAKEQNQYLKGQKVQFKCFVAEFGWDRKSHTEIVWENRHNRVIDLQKANEKEIQVCSFNIRYLNNEDKNKNNWEYRKNLIKDFLLEKNYDIIGIQQAVKNQREFLTSFLSNYQYFGRPRDLHCGQQCGIFVKKDKFTVIEDQYCWISQSKQPGSVGYDGRLPRYFTFLAITPTVITTESESQLIPIYFLINVHLDYEGDIAKKQGLIHIVEKIKEMTHKYSNNSKVSVCGAITMGDFNTPEGSPRLQILTEHPQFPMKSLRSLENADKYFTFNGFINKYLLKVASLVVDNPLTIDHIYFWDNEKAEKHRLVPYSLKVERQSKEYLSDHYPLVGLFKF